MDANAPEITAEPITVTVYNDLWMVTTDFTLTVRPPTCTVTSNRSAPTELSYVIGDDQLDIVFGEYFVVSDACSSVSYEPSYNGGAPLSHTSEKASIHLTDYSDTYTGDWALQIVAESDSEASSQVDVTISVTNPCSETELTQL